MGFNVLITEYENSDLLKSSTQRQFYIYRSYLSSKVGLRMVPRTVVDSPVSPCWTTLLSRDDPDSLSDLPLTEAVPEKYRRRPRRHSLRSYI